MVFIKSPLVVGYKGEIGSYILNNLLKTFPKASNIWCVDINDTYKDVIKRIKLSDVIFLCVPLQDTYNWIKIYKRYLKNKVIVEQCSLKSQLFNSSTEKITKVLNFISMHILFRPSTTFDNKDKNYIIYSGNNYYNVRKIIEDIKIIMKDCNMIDLFKVNNKLEHIEHIHHDKIMATQQALVHRIILVLSKQIEECEIGKTYIGNQIIKLSDRIKSGDPKLYEIIQNNPELSWVKGIFEYDLKEFDINNYF
jgi:prephenate dehydrogenase